MTDQTNPAASVAEDVQAAASELIGARLAMRHTLACVLLALAKRGSVDLAGDLFPLLRTSAAIFLAPSGLDAEPWLAKARAVAAEEMAALEPTIRNMVTIPQGAGRA